MSKERGVTVTVKYSKDYDAPWVVFHGSVDEVKEDMGIWFGQEEAAKTLDGHDLLSGLYNAFKAQGGSSGGRGRGKAPAADPAPAEPISVEVEEARPLVDAESLVEIVIMQIKTATDEGILDLWRQYKKAFEDARVQRAVKDRKAELTKSN